MKLTTCKTCGAVFSRRDNMMRHIRSKHSFIQPYPPNTSVQPLPSPNTTPPQFTMPPPPPHTPPPPQLPSYIPPPPPPPPPLHTPPPLPLHMPPPPLPMKVVLQHPFTMILCGPIATFSGKSCWMNNLLERARLMIKPPPQRIIWCY